MKKVKELKKWIELYNEVHAAAEELQLAYDYVKEGIVSEEEVGLPCCSVCIRVGRRRMDIRFP